MRTPEGVWDWIGKKRRELKSLGIYLTSREMFDYFRGANIAKTHRLRTVIQNHFMAAEFVKQLETCEAWDFRDDFRKFPRAIDAHLNTDAPAKQFGEADVYDNAKLNLANSARFHDREVNVFLGAKRGKEEEDK